MSSQQILPAQEMSIRELGFLKEEASQDIQQRFMPFFKKAKEWKEKAMQLNVTDVSQKEEMKLARDARIALKNIRVEANKTRKTLKESSIRYGKAVKGVYNVMAYLIEPIEEHLENQEKFVQRKEAERKRLQDIAAKQKKENERLKREAQEAKKRADEANRLREEQIERDRASRELESKRLAKIEQERLKRDKAERDRIQKIADAKAKESDKLKKQLELKRIETEKMIAEQKRIQKEQEEAKKEALRQKQIAPDREKLMHLIADIEAIQLPAMSTNVGKSAVADIKGEIRSLIGYITKKQDNL